MEKVCEKIINDYLNNSFNENEYYFYANRRDYKDLHRTGIINFNGRKYFFKIIDEFNRVDEDFIQSNIKPNFSIAKKLFEKSFGSKILLLYECLNTIEINCYNYLRSLVSFSEKKNKFKNFMNDYIQLQRNSAIKSLSNKKYLSDTFFIERCRDGARINDYYSANLSNLIHDVKNLGFDFRAFENLNALINQQINNHNETVVAYNHGDFHDFNFSLEKIFWDVDTFGINPILNDFVIYYWHFYARENYLITKYNWWLAENMFNKLNKNENMQIYKLKEGEIKKWWKFVYSQFKVNNLLNALKDEFIFRLFCRVFLVDNVLKMEKEDRMKIYSFFIEMLNSKLDENGDFLFNLKNKFNY